MPSKLLLPGISSFRTPCSQSIGRLSPAGHSRKASINIVCCQAASNRRAILGAGASILLFQSAARATEVFQFSASSQELPRNYVKFARKLLSALRDAIEADLSPASENEVRRKADPAKALVKDWVKNWRDAPAVSREVSYTEISDSLQLLGNFYREKGQRARLSEQLGGEILRHLDAASAALPANV